jgi:glutaredoxin-like protein
MIPLADQELIRQKFAQELVGQVKIDFFTERELGLSVPGKQPCAYCKPAREMLQELAGLSDWISLRIHYLEDNPAEAASFGITRVPAVVLRGPSHGAEDTRFYAFYGMPAGTEFPSFLETISDVSRGEVLLSEGSITALAAITTEVTVRVFVTPTCPYCPAMVRLAHQMTMANPLVRSEGIEVNEFPDLGERYSVQAVPLTVINDRVAIPGMVPEEALVEQVVKAAQGSAASKPVEGPTNEVTPAAPSAPRIERGKERPSGLYIP